MNDFMICGALLYDGTGHPPYPADVAVTESRVAAVAPAGKLHRTGFREIRADGLSLSPGFIDAHGHSDVSILAAPEASGKISQGVTTEITGNCGLSAFPVLTDEVREHLANLYAAYHVPITWSTLDDYAMELNRREPAINIASLCGHNTLRANISGYGGRTLAAAELNRMAELLGQALHQGAAGLSTGLLYTPGRFADTAELLHLMSVLKKFDRLYATHLRSEGDQLTEALEEAVFLAKNGSRKLQVSHLKTALPRNWDKLDRVLELIRNAQSCGIRLTADRYPYIRSQTSLSVILPPPYDAMDDISIRRTLCENPAEQQKTARELAKSGRDWDSILLTASNCMEYAYLSGKTIAEASKQLGMQPEDFCVDLMAKDAPGTMAAFAGMSENNLKRILAEEWVCCGTDESARPFDESIGRSHPRGFGSFPEFMKRVAAESGMSEAVRRVTSLPASVFSLKNRGIVREGAFADLVLFDEADFHANADFTEPHKPASGIRMVWVNGTLSCGCCLDRTGKRSGTFLRIC